MNADERGLGEAPAASPDVSDEDIRRLQQQRFAARVERVLAVMREERVDWRGIAFITQEGRIGVRVVPVDLSAGRLAEAGQP